MVRRLYKQLVHSTQRLSFIVSAMTSANSENLEAENIVPPKVIRFA